MGRVVGLGYINALFVVLMKIVILFSLSSA